VEQYALNIPLPAPCIQTKKKYFRTMNQPLKRILYSVLVFLTTNLVLDSCKAKKCPAYHEAERTGGTIDKNKKNKRKSSGDLFGPKVKRKMKF
jgi:hypothetical protein